MTQPIKETHEGKQRQYFLLFLYSIIVIGLTTYIAFADIWPITFFQDLLLDSNNMYPVKAVFVLTLISIGIVLFPIYWVLKKIISSKNLTEALSMPTEIGIDRKEYTFTYSATVNTVILDGKFLQVKIGFAKRLFLTSRIRNFYLMSKNTHQTLYLTFEDESGKIKKVALNADAIEPQMNLLISELKTRFPDKSLNHLPQADAFKIMNVINPVLIASIVLFVLLLISIVVIYLVVN